MHKVTLKRCRALSSFTSSFIGFKCCYVQQCLYQWNFLSCFLLVYDSKHNKSSKNKTYTKMKLCTSVKYISTIYLFYSLNSFMLIIKPVISVPPITSIPDVPIKEIGEKVIYTISTFTHAKCIIPKCK